MSLSPRSFLSFLVILFSVQILSANFFLEQCHHREADGTSVSLSIQNENSDKASSHQDSHCSDFGFCLAGHCHMNHCPVFVSDSGVVVAGFFFQDSIGIPKETTLVSLLTQKRPWQPPRAA